MTSGPLAGRCVVLTRPTVGSLSTRLGELGASVVHVPLIAIGDPSDEGDALAQVLGRLEEFDWLVVTSANGAQRVGSAARRHRLLRLAAVGATTAAVLAELAGRPVDLVPTVQRTEGLLDVFPNGRSSVLIAQGNLADDALATGIRALGHRVVVAEAYVTTLRTPGVDDRQRLSDADAVVVASGSAVLAWIGADGTGDSSTATRSTKAALVAIGPRTAAVAAEHGLSVASVAATPSDRDVVAAVVAALA